MRGNVICLPKSGSSYVAKLLGSVAIHEYDHERISMLTLESDPTARNALASYYLANRSEELCNHIDVCTSKIFLLSYLADYEYALPTVFLFRDPLHWCRSILSYSVSVAQSGGYHDWVSHFQSNFCSDYPLTLSDIACEQALVQHLSILLPRLSKVWFNSYSHVLSLLPSFSVPLVLTTSSLSIHYRNIVSHFGLSDLATEFCSIERINSSMQLNLISEECNAYFEAYTPLPTAITAESMQEYLNSFSDWCKSRQIPLL